MHSWNSVDLNGGYGLLPMSFWLISGISRVISGMFRLINGISRLSNGSNRLSNGISWLINAIKSPCNMKSVHFVMSWSPRIWIFSDTPKKGIEETRKCPETFQNIQLLGQIEIL